MIQPLKWLWTEQRFTRHAGLFAALCLLLMFGVTAGEAPTDKDKKGDKGDKKDDKDKPKEEPLKYSAWCAFRDLSVIPLPAQPDPKTTQTRPGVTQFSGFGRRGRWAHVVLELKNTTEKDEFRGTATIVWNPTKENAAGQIPYRTSYRQEVEIGPQSEKQYHFSILCPEEGWSDAVTVNLTMNGRPYDPRSIQLVDLDTGDDDFIVVISENSGAFRGLGSKRRNMEDELEPQSRHRHVAVVEPTEVPNRWHDLMLANLIIIDGPPREKLTDAQWTALRSYVQGGGHVLISAGKDPGRLRGPLEDLAGISVREMVEVESLDAIVPGYTPVRKDSKLPLIEVTANAETKESGLVRYNPTTKYIEMTRRFYGSGSVTFLPFSMSDTLLEHWEGRRKIPIAIMEQGLTTSLFFKKEEQKKKTNPFLYYEEEKRLEGLSLLRSKLEDSFRNDTPVQLQKPPMVLSFLLFYLLCAVPGNYLLFGWFKRREVAWLAVPLWAASFSVLAYVVGYMGQTGDLTVNQVSVIEASPRQEIGIARTFMALYAPRRDDYRLTFPPEKLKNDTLFEQQAGPGHLIDVTRAEAKNIDLPDLHLLDNDNGLTIEGLLVQQRSTRQLEIKHRKSLAGGIDARVRERRGLKNVLDLNITNNTEKDLLYPVYIFEGRAVALGNDSNGTRLTAGGTNQLGGIGTNETPWQDIDQLFFGRNITFRSARGQHAANRARALNEFLRQRIDAYPSGVICAWIEGGALDVRVGGSGDEPAPVKNLEGLSLLLVPVSIREEGSRLDLATLLRVRYVNDVDGAAKPEWVELTDSKVSLHPVPPDREQIVLALNVPEAARNLAANSYELQLKFALAMEKQPNRAAAASTGELKVEVRRKDDRGRLTWHELSSTIYQDLYTIKTFQHPVVKMKLDDFRIRTEGDIWIRISVRKFGDRQKLELRSVDYKMVRQTEERR